MPASISTSDASLAATGIPTCILWTNLRKTCILKLEPDDDLDEVETFRPSKLNS